MLRGKGCGKEAANVTRRVALGELSTPSRTRRGVLVSGESRCRTCLHILVAHHDVLVVMLVLMLMLLAITPAIREPAAQELDRRAEIADGALGDLRPPAAYIAVAVDLLGDLLGLRAV